MKSYQTLSACVVLSAAVLSQSAFAQPGDANSLTPSQVNQVQGVVHDYLVTNPQVLVEASQTLQKQEMQQVEQRAKTGITKNAKQIFADAASPVAGNPKGTVTIVEFFDYQCPHCKDMKPVMDKVIANNADVRVVFKELPIFGDTSRDASAAALAAAKQGADKYYKLHEALLAAENPLNREKVLAVAKTVGLNVDQLSKDMQSPEVQKQIDSNLQLAQVLNLMGTPTFIISKWTVGSASNDAKNAAFVPGMPTVEELQGLVVKAKKS